MQRRELLPGGIHDCYWQRELHRRVLLRCGLYNEPRYHRHRLRDGVPRRIIQLGRRLNRRLPDLSGFDVVRLLWG